MDYYHLDRPGSWIGRRSHVTETPRTGGQQGPPILLPLEQQVTLQGSAFDYVREEGLDRQIAQTSESELDVRRNRGKKAGAKTHTRNNVKVHVRVNHLKVLIFKAKYNPYNIKYK